MLYSPGGGFQEGRLNRVQWLKDRAKSSQLLSSFRLGLLDRYVYECGNYEGSIIARLIKL